MKENKETKLKTNGQKEAALIQGGVEWPSFTDSNFSTQHTTRE
jgi:hypothetical protein